MWFFCPLGLVTDLNTICNACLAGVPSGSLKMCPVNLSLFDLFFSVHKCCLAIAYVSVFVVVIWVVYVQ